jgi:hypothetical protein
MVKELQREQGNYTNVPICKYANLEQYEVFVTGLSLAYWHIVTLAYCHILFHHIFTP